MPAPPKALFSWVPTSGSPQWKSCSPRAMSSPELSTRPGDSPFGEPAHFGAYETGSHPYQYRTRPVSGRRGGSRSPEKQYPCRIRCRRDKHRTTFGRPSLLSAPNAYLTPHIASATREARLRLMDICEQNIRAFLEGKPQNVVNP